MYRRWEHAVKSRGSLWIWKLDSCWNSTQIHRRWNFPPSIVPILVRESGWLFQEWLEKVASSHYTSSSSHHGRIFAFIHCCLYSLESDHLDHAQFLPGKCDITFDDHTHDRKKLQLDLSCIPVPADSISCPLLQRRRAKRLGCLSPLPVDVLYGVCKFCIRHV